MYNRSYRVSDDKFIVLTRLIIPICVVIYAIRHTVLNSTPILANRHHKRAS